jgi:hypothetical protein
MGAVRTARGTERCGLWPEGAVGVRARTFHETMNTVCNAYAHSNLNLIVFLSVLTAVTSNEAFM